ncbi:MAG TPA: DUF3325 domain-containing protein [Polyangia bacterium]
MSGFVAVLLLVAALLSAGLGFALLALTQHVHWRVVAAPETGGTRPDRTGVRPRRWGASLALAMSVGLCFAAEGPAFGSLLAVLFAGTAAAAVTFVLSYRPHWLRRLAGK